MISFLIIAFLVGSYSEQIQHVAIVGIVVLAGAGIAQRFWPRATSS